MTNLFQFNHSVETVAINVWIRRVDTSRGYVAMHEYDGNDTRKCS